MNSLLLAALVLSLWATWRLRRHRPYLFVLASGLLAGGAQEASSGLLSGGEVHDIALAACLLGLLGTATTFHSIRKRSDQMARERRRVGHPTRQAVAWRLAESVMRQEPGATEAVRETAPRLAAADIAVFRSRNRAEALIRRRDEIASDILLKATLLRANPQYNWQAEVAEAQTRRDFLLRVDRMVAGDFRVAALLAVGLAGVVAALVS